MLHIKVELLRLTLSPMSASILFELVCHNAIVLKRVWIELFMDSEDEQLQRQFMKGVLFSIVVVALLGGVVTMCNRVLIDGTCGNEIHAEQKSPDGKLKVVEFMRNCGATTGYNVQISILPTDHALPNCQRRFGTA